jgi:hypothetical protein
MINYFSKPFLEALRGNKVLPKEEVTYKNKFKTGKK